MTDMNTKGIIPGPPNAAWLGYWIYSMDRVTGSTEADARAAAADYIARNPHTGPIEDWEFFKNGEARQRSVHPRR